jgi:hypothetical protein
VRAVLQKIKIVTRLIVQSFVDFNVDVLKGKYLKEKKATHYRSVI